MLVLKQAPLTIKERTATGGQIIISTPGRDRDRDRVLPLGAQIGNYLKNPIVQYGHNYSDPWATIGRTTSLEVSEQGLQAAFELRDPVSDTDPMTIIRALWEQEYLRTASIGFIPLTSAPNDIGGLDFASWELLEWSLVPIPANPDALALAAKHHPAAQAAVWKRGRVLSRANESKLRTAYESIGEVLTAVEGDPDDDAKAIDYARLHDALARLNATLRRNA